MKRSPMKQDPRFHLLATLLMLCMLLLTLSPAALAASGSARMREMPRPHGLRIRVENGIVTDDDGIIGNSATGADHAPRTHRSAHRSAHRSMSHRHPSYPTMSDRGIIGGITDGAADITRGRALPEESSPEASNGAPDTADGDAHNEDGMIGEGNAENGVIEKDDSTANDGIANDDVADGGMTDGEVGNAGATEDGNATARSILPWIITIIVILAAVLVVLALTPKNRRRS